MLAASGCDFRRIDEHAFDIVPRPPRRRSAVTANATARSPDNADLSELVVVANRRPTPAERLAYSVSSISGATLTEQGVRDLNGLSTITPAMTLTNLGMGRDKVLLRG